MDPKEATLEPNEYHPIANSAMAWYNTWKMDTVKYMMTKESLASTALAGNRAADLCLSTMNRIEVGQSVSDRYLLALCWMLREMEDDRNAKGK
jgi:hypothetical protein